MGKSAATEDQLMDIVLEAGGEDLTRRRRVVGDPDRSGEL